MGDKERRDAHAQRQMDCYVISVNGATGKEVARRGFYDRAGGEAYAQEMQSHGFATTLVPLR